MSMARPKQKVIVRMNAPVERGVGSAGCRLLIVCLLGALALSIFRWENGIDGAIYQGVKIAGVDVGGESIAAARLRLQPVGPGPYQSWQYRAGRRPRLEVTPSQLGMKLDSRPATAQAYALGREDDLLNRYSTQVTMRCRAAPSRSSATTTAACCRPSSNKWQRCLSAGASRPSSACKMPEPWSLPMPRAG